jgi:hypothetical protein
MILLPLVLFEGPCEPFAFLFTVSSDGIWRVWQYEGEYDSQANSGHTLDQKKLFKPGTQLAVRKKAGLDTHPSPPL